MDKKEKIRKALIEAKFMAKAEDMDKLMPKLDDDDMVKLVDEAEITEDENERAGRGVEYGAEDGELTDADWEDLHKRMNEDDTINNTIDSSKLRSDVAKFIDKLQLQQFDTILQRIDKPQEQAEIIAAFAERIGVPRAKSPQVIASIKNVAENAKITKSKLIEFVTTKK